MAQKYLGGKERKELQLNTLNEAELNTELNINTFAGGRRLTPFYPTLKAS
jgi:hypothetical protein